MSDFLSLKHGTCSCKAEKIIESGFKQFSYFTDSNEIAEYYGMEALCECDERCGDYDVLEILVPKTQLFVDYNSFEEPLKCFLNEHADSQEEWLEMIENKQIPFPKNEKDIETSLEVVRSVYSENKVDYIKG
jgi:hypothetical protein